MFLKLGSSLVNLHQVQEVEIRDDGTLIVIKERRPGGMIVVADDDRPAWLAALEELRLRPAPVAEPAPVPVTEPVAVAPAAPVVAPAPVAEPEPDPAPNAE